MKRTTVFLALVFSLAACADLGRYPGQSDVGCLRQQMGPAENLTFEMAASVCAKYTDDHTLTQLNSHLLPLNLRGAPDLQIQARQIDYPFTD